MKKAILISIRPEWVAKILNGEKTIEIRTTMPKCKLPIDVYIYCTKGKPNLWLPYEFGLDKTSQPYLSDKPLFDIDDKMNGKVVAKFTLAQYDVFVNGLNFLERYCGGVDEECTYEEVMKQACLTNEEAEKYAPNKSFYAWFISNLEIFDEPKELSNFFFLPETYHHDHESMVDYYERKEARRLKRAPQSWQYVEVTK